MIKKALAKENFWLAEWKLGGMGIGYENLIGGCKKALLDLEKLDEVLNVLASFPHCCYTKVVEYRRTRGS